MVKQKIKVLQLEIESYIKLFGITQPQKRSKQTPEPTPEPTPAPTPWIEPCPKQSTTTIVCTYPIDDGCFYALPEGEQCSLTVERIVQK